jgi:aminoglycoside phosphotransferase (APT) family kinase protein
VPSAPVDPLKLPAPVVEWIEEVTGSTVERSDRRPGGARKEAWFVDVRGDDGVRPLFLRYDRSDPSVTGDPWTLRREATVYVALQGTDVLVPTVVAVHPTEQAMLTERVTGENWFSRIRDPDEQLSVARDFMTRLAALHHLDPDDLELPGFPTTRSVPELVERELDEWERVIEFRGGQPDPELRLSLDWLRANVPDYQGPPVLVQGDTGPGNFMYADGKVVAVVDWELAHLGDPMDDIAWLSLRAVQEPFTHLPDRLAEYSELSGNPIDEHRVHYYRVMAETKLLVMRHSPAAHGAQRSGGGGGDVGNALIYGVLHRRLWLEALAEVMEIAEPRAEVPPAREPSDADRLFDHVLGQLRDVVVPRVDDPLALQRTKGVARILKYLAEVQRDGAFYDAREIDDVEAALGGRPADVDEARAAMAAAVGTGRISAVEYLEYVWRRVARENELLRPASGVMADRHWPPLH